MVVKAKRSFITPLPRRLATLLHHIPGYHRNACLVVIGKTFCRKAGLGLVDNGPERAAQVHTPVLAAKELLRAGLTNKTALVSFDAIRTQVYVFFQE